MVKLKKFVVTFSGGEYDGYYEYPQVVEAEDADTIEFILLERLKNGTNYAEDIGFESYHIQPLSEWIEKETIKLINLENPN